MKDLLEKIKDVEADACVTVILNTHRNKPDIQKDVILLKNLITEAEQNLLNSFDKRFAEPIISKLKSVSENIDHGHNLDSLILFVNEDVSEYVKLPVEVEDRVVIDRKFAISDLVRACQLEEPYYVLVLSRDKARLIEAINDEEIREVDFPFPIENTDLYLTSDKELSKPKQKDLMIEEFFNRVDKTLWSTINGDNHPVVVCTEERNYFHYLKISDNKNRIIGHLNQIRINEKAVKIIHESWPIVLKYLNKKNNQKIKELQQAVNSGKFISDTSEIWRALNEGRGQTLFVQKGFYQPAKLAINLVEVMDNQTHIHEDDTENIIEKIVSVNLKNGGDVVFLEAEDLKDFQGLALVTRY